ncbi:MAG TPA: hypothetical protein VEY70_05935 [Metabacillus sp.]|nr:hypothetical protein [Metabacillus sp.]
MRKKWLLTLSGSLLAAMLVTGCAADDEDPAPPEDTNENGPVEEGLEEGGDVIEEGVNEGENMLEEGANEGEDMLEEGNVNEDQNGNEAQNADEEEAKKEENK